MDAVSTYVWMLCRSRRPEVSALRSCLPAGLFCCCFAATRRLSVRAAVLRLRRQSRVHPLGLPCAPRGRQVSRGFSFLADSFPGGLRCSCRRGIRLLQRRARCGRFVCAGLLFDRRSMATGQADRGQLLLRHGALWPEFSASTDAIFPSERDRGWLPGRARHCPPHSAAGTISYCVSTAVTFSAHVAARNR